MCDDSYSLGYEMGYDEGYDDGYSDAVDESSSVGDEHSEEYHDSTFKCRQNTLTDFLRNVFDLGRFQRK
ncbi:MAG: hypothetical protein BZ137_00450 [Methanosphaera sp. rholeuAM130]|nr:MAG: hypothetical protein BZ137_00450 [Methanosphaera sp. rholeuAM130]